MRSMIKILLPMIFVLYGCQNIDTNAIEPPYHVVLNEKGKSKNISIPASSSLEKQITLFLRSNAEGWKSLRSTPPIPELMIYGKGFNMSLSNDELILQYHPEKGEDYIGIKAGNEETLKLRDDLLKFINKF